MRHITLRTSLLSVLLGSFLVLSFLGCQSTENQEHREEHHQHAERHMEGDMEGDMEDHHSNVLEEGEYESEDLVEQPGVENGQITKCPMTGEVFRVTEEAPSYTHEGSTYYFCCPNCRKKVKQDPSRLPEN